MKILDAAATRQALPYHALIAAMRAAFRSGLRSPDRQHLTLPMEGEPDGTLLLMPAWDAKYGCVKIVTVTPGNGARSLPAVAGSVLVFDRATGQHLAMLEGSVLTARRTAAASALGADILARPDAHTLLVVGAGTVAAELPAAFAAVRDLTRVLVWNRSDAGATRLVAALQEQGMPAEHAPNLEAAVAQVDMISCATLSQNPLIKGEWLKPGQHVDLLGAFTPAMREVDDTALQRSRIFVDTPFAKVEAGELKIPLDSGAISESDILGDLQLMCNAKVGRGAADGITLFKSVGNAVMDLSAARTAMVETA